MSAQSTQHLLMIEPSSFYANPETMATNVYQVDEHEPRDETFRRALEEFRNFRDVLVANGVIITSAKAYAECPDMVFPNWSSTHRGAGHLEGLMFLYPMLNANRQKERSPEIIEMLEKNYPRCEIWTSYEGQGMALESTASIVMDRVNSIGYAALSARTDESLVRKWCAEMGYEAVIFETRSHAEKPVYHTDCVMWIGTTLAGLCTSTVVEKDRARVLAKLQETHEVVEFDGEQLRAFCGNALEVVGAGGKKMLAMSTRAYQALSEEQEKLILRHFAKILHSPLATLEKYGGGSARCMLMELF